MKKLPRVSGAKRGGFNEGKGKYGLADGSLSYAKDLLFKACTEPEPKAKISFLLLFFPKEYHAVSITRGPIVPIFTGQ
jgi:hypothetical protein